MAQAMDRVYAGQESSARLCDRMMRIVLSHYSRPARREAGKRLPIRHALIVTHARDYIEANLQNDISIDEMARAVKTTPRTLHRAFRDVFGDTPYDFVQRLRLHRVRRDLCSEAEAARTIGMIASRWELNEPGRFSGMYRELFGETPFATRQAFRTNGRPK
jgi:AraC-like DNA-binding protein